MARSRLWPLLAAAWFAACSSLALGDDLTVVGFNVESGGADPNVVARFVADFSGCDLWGFSEVQSDRWAQIFENAAAKGENAEFRRVLGTTGGNDRLLIVYNAKRFELLDNEELHDINPGGRVRSPLVGRFRARGNGAEFLFVVNHLYRGNEDARHEQARKLNGWARRQDLPIVVVGDHNFDWDVPNGEARHDAGFDFMTAGGVFSWVRPAQLVPSQCSERFYSILDFVFVSGDAQHWHSTSTIVVRDGDCPDDDRTSDHRPVVATFSGGPWAEPEQPLAIAAAATRDTVRPSRQLRSKLLDRVQRIEDELAELRRLINELPD